MKITKILGLLFSTLVAAQSHAGLITGTTATLVSGQLDGGTTASMIVNGHISAEGTHYRGYEGNGTPLNAFWDRSPTTGSDVVFQVDLGDVYNLQDILISVDNNDAYAVTYSVDQGGIFQDLFTILRTYGSISSGMDTFSTISGDVQYDANIDFTAVNARYLRIAAAAPELQSDWRFSVSEIQAYGIAIEPTNQNSVPAPSTLALIGIGTLALGLRRRKACRQG